MLAINGVITVVWLTKIAVGFTSAQASSSSPVAEYDFDGGGIDTEPSTLQRDASSSQGYNVKRVYFGCSLWKTDSCSANLTNSLLSSFSKQFVNPFAANVVTVVRFYNYNNVRMRVFTQSRSDSTRVTLFDTDAKCKAQLRDCSAYSALLGTGVDSTVPDYHCPPCVWNHRAPNGLAQFFQDKSQLYRHLTVVLERVKSVPIERSCGATIIRADFVETRSSLLRSTLLEDVRRDPLLPKSAYVSTGDDICEARDEAINLGFDMFLCIGSPLSSNSATVSSVVAAEKPTFAKELCSISIATQVNDRELYLRTISTQGSAGGSINRTIFIGVILPLSAFVIAAGFIWCYRTKCPMGNGGRLSSLNLSSTISNNRRQEHRSGGPPVITSGRGLTLTSSSYLVAPPSSTAQLLLASDISEAIPSEADCPPSYEECLRASAPSTSEQVLLLQKPDDDAANESTDIAATDETTISPENTNQSQTKPD